MFISRDRYESETRIKSLAIVVDETHEFCGELLCLDMVSCDASRGDNVARYTFIRSKTGKKFHLDDDYDSPKRFIRFRTVSDLNTYLDSVKLSFYKV